MQKGPGMPTVEPSIAYRNLDFSPALEEQVRRRFADLHKLESRMESCHVVIEAADRRRSSGREFTVRLKLVVPGPDIDVERSIARSDAAADVGLAIHEVFDTARRLILERKSRRAS